MSILSDLQGPADLRGMDEAHLANVTRLERELAEAKDQLRDCQVRADDRLERLDKAERELAEAREENKEGDELIAGLQRDSDENFELFEKAEAERDDYKRRWLEAQRKYEDAIGHDPPHE